MVSTWMRDPKISRAFLSIQNNTTHAMVENSFNMEPVALPPFQILSFGNYVKETAKCQIHNLQT